MYLLLLVDYIAAFTHIPISSLAVYFNHLHGFLNILSTKYLSAYKSIISIASSIFSQIMLSFVISFFLTLIVCNTSFFRYVFQLVLRFIAGEELGGIARYVLPTF